MGKTMWTEHQKEAINTPPSVLVNAAAGSGKTAVLVERIIKKLDTVDIDKLLIVTFAKDAADQMQQRIKKALVTGIRETNNEKKRALYKRQLRLLPYSQITTIDAFCINAVKQNFHMLGIDPAFKIIDSDEAKIMLENAVDTFIEDMYDSVDDRIDILTQSYSNGFNDYRLKKMIIQLFEFTRSLPNPEEWLLQSAEQYKDTKYWKNHISERVKALADDIKFNINEAVKEFTFNALGKRIDFEDLDENATQVLDEYDNKGLWRSLCRDYESLKFFENNDWDSIYEGASKITSFSMQYMSGDHKEERKKVINIKNKAALMAEEILSVMCLPSEPLEKVCCTRIHPQIKILCEVTCEFCDYYFKIKKHRNIFEFSDIEHLTLKLLREFNTDIKGKYSEILMDEYQDTNALQEEIFSNICDKRFMVGDMKQSIYRFRNSDPLIFKNKDILFKKNKNLGTRVILSENFRSRPQVLNSINEIFSRIMSERIGEIEYDESQSLKWGNKSYTEPENEKYFSELYILEGHDDTNEDTDTAIEARFIAQKIREMIDSGFEITDGEGKRPVRAGDFVILLSSVKTVSAIYKKELERVKIDSYSESTGYLDKTEVKLMLNIIRVINNPLQDIPLVAVLRSAVFGFTEDELSIIRRTKKGFFYEAVKEAAKREDLAVSEKCVAFCKTLERFREYASYMTADKLIWTVFEETSFYDLMGIIYRGEEAQANLRLLFERARQYEQTGYKGLFHFLKFIDSMEKSSSMGGAQLISDSSDIVRIMTIHKSKGLEFPICFLAGTGKRFSIISDGILDLHKDWGIGVDYVDAEKGIFSKTPVNAVIKSVKKAEEMSENMRKLYVGMTRAKEKLIVTGVVDGKKSNGEGGYFKELEKWKQLYNIEKDFMEPSDVGKAFRYIDWLAPIILAHSKQIGWYSHVLEHNSEEVLNDEVQDMQQTVDISDELIDSLFKVKSKSMVKLPGKISVTGIEKLKRNTMTEEDAVDTVIEERNYEKEQTISNMKRPSFLKRESVSGTERGIAFHTVMSKIRLTQKITLDYIEGEINRLLSDHLLTEAEAKAVESSKILEFFDSSLGERLIKSSFVLREEPFEIMTNGEEILYNAEYKECEILLQGVIDCAFEENGEIILVDYKTDKNADKNTLIHNYSNQILWYKVAIEKLLGKKVKEGILYAFENGNQIRIF